MSGLDVYVRWRLTGLPDRAADNGWMGSAQRCMPRKASWSGLLTAEMLRCLVRSLAPRCAAEAAIKLPADRPMSVFISYCPSVII